MDLDWIERCWRDQDEAPRLEERNVMRMIEARTRELRRDVRRRLRREAGYYTPILIVTVVALVSGDVTPNRLIAAASVALLLGGIMTTLSLAERSIESAPLDQCLRESLGRLMSQIEFAGRAYVLAYVAMFVVAGIALVGFVWSRRGVGVPLALTVGASALAVAWSVQSGRAYVERMFRRYRAGLAECLNQLEA
jgi:hypothetical protein